MQIRNEGKLSQAVHNRVSFFFPDNTNIDDFPLTTRSWIEVPMSPLQYQLYRVMEDEMLDAAARRLMDRTPTTAVLTGEAKGRAASLLNSFLSRTRQVSNSAAHVSSQEPVSNKHREIVRMLERHPFPALVFSNFLGAGLQPLNDYMATMHTDWRIRLVTGETAVRQAAQDVHDFNSGKVDILMLSAALGEGVDLKGTRQVHIMEPHWNSGRVEQAIGRAIRFKSHSHLPIDQRHVHVFQYISTRPSIQQNPWTFFDVFRINAYLPTADQQLRKMSEMKTKIISAFMDFLSRHSIQNNMFHKDNRKDISKHSHRRQKRTQQRQSSKRKSMRKSKRKSRRKSMRKSRWQSSRRRHSRKRQRGSN